MSFSLVKGRTFGIYIDEPLTKRAKQYAELYITGLASDVDLDIGDDSPGSFWTDALADSTYGTIATNLQDALQEVVSRSEKLIGIKEDFMLTMDQVSGRGLALISSDAGSGGGADETMTVTGLLATDQILAVTQRVQGANNTAMTGWNTQADDALDIEYTGDPGAGSVVDVLVAREGAAVAAGEYSVAIHNKRPNITFAAGDAPTAYRLELEWLLQEGVQPIRAEYGY